MKKIKKVYFTYFLLLFSTLFLIGIFIYRPQKANTIYLYNTGVEPIKKEVNFPVVEEITLDEKSQIFSIDFGDSILENGVYNIKVLNEKDEAIFEHDYEKYESSIVNIGLDVNKINEKEKYKIIIECEDCSYVEVPLAEPISSGISLNEDKKSTLKISCIYMSDNNSLFWYPIMGVIVGLTLYPLAKMEDRCRDNE